MNVAQYLEAQRLKAQPEAQRLEAQREEEHLVAECLEAVRMRTTPLHRPRYGVISKVLLSVWLFALCVPCLFPSCIF